MAIESPISELAQWFLDEDKTLRWYIVTGDPVIANTTAVQGDEEITVLPLVSSLASGSKLRFGNQVLTLTATADVGDTTVLVSALTGSIKKGSVGRGIQDVTGWTTEFKLLTAKGGSTILYTGAGAISSAVNGVIDVVIADDAIAVSGNDYYYTFRRTDSGSEQLLAHGKVVLQSVGGS